MRARAVVIRPDAVERFTADLAAAHAGVEGQVLLLQETLAALGAHVAPHIKVFLWQEGEEKEEEEEG